MTTAAPSIARPTVPAVPEQAPKTTTLAGEHALLMRDVVRRAEPILALLDARAWPHAELGTLARFLRAAVLRQVSDEEALLFPHDSSAPPFAELSAAHVRLHTLTAQLESAHTHRCTPAELRALVEQLLSTLRRHLVEEQAVLAALPDAPGDVPSAAALAALRYGVAHTATDLEQTLRVTRRHAG
jgi:hypothetical protein